MEKRNLGRDRVAAVGLGAMSFAGVYGATTEEVSHATLAAMLDLGMDHVDTSNIYGMGVSEEVIGRFLARQGKARGKLFHIATKAAIRVDRDANRRWFDNSAEHLTSELEGSLKRLGLETVDLFYVHRRDRTVPIEEVTGTLAGLVAAGKVRAFGFSEIAPTTLYRAAREHPVAAVQSEYSLATRAPELGLIQACEALGTTLVAFSPLGRGLITDTPPDAERVAASDFLRANPRFETGNLARNLAATEDFRRLAADMGTTASGLAIAWLLARGPGVVPIPGTRSPEHLKELAAGAALELDAADIARVETVLPVGWCHGDRYSDAQWTGPERFC